MPNTQNQSVRFTPLVLALFILLAAFSWMLLAGNVGAVPFSESFVRLDRLSATTATGGRVCARPSATNLAQVEASVQVTFPTTAATDYVVNATAANWTVTTTGLDAGQTAWPGIGTATAVSGKTVTFPSTDLASSATLYCFNFSATNTLTTSSAGATETTKGTVTTRTLAPATIDQTTYSQSIISNDQVVVNAVVPPSFTFSLSGNTDSFTTDLSTSSVVSTSGRSVTITTNAPNGWIVWVRDLNNNGAGRGSLRSATAGNYNIAAAAAVGTAARTLTSGTEDYGLGVIVNTDAAGGGTVSVDAAYDGTVTKAGTLDPTQFRPIASANGTANGDIITLLERATIAGQTPAAADYTDTLTVIGAGRF